MEARNNPIARLLAQTTICAQEAQTPLCVQQVPLAPGMQLTQKVNLCCANQQTKANSLSPPQLHKAHVPTASIAHLMPLNATIALRAIIAQVELGHLALLENTVLKVPAPLKIA